MSKNNATVAIAKTAVPNVDLNTIFFCLTDNKNRFWKINAQSNIRFPSLNFRIKKDSNVMKSNLS